jgi:Fe-S cluster assembly protein SufD
VGQIDQEALFYMQSRGIPAVAARQLLIHAFAGEVLDLMKWEPAREKLATELHGILSEVLEVGRA